MHWILPARRLFPIHALVLSFLVLVSGCAVTRPIARLDGSSLPAEPAAAIALDPSRAAPERQQKPRIEAETPPAPKRPRGQVGVASYYGGFFHGRPTASGETFDQTELTAAHRTLEFGTRLRVTNLENKKAVIVTVNDRGPFVRGRVIDLSRRAARVLGFLEEGVARVRIQPLG